MPREKSLPFIYGALVFVLSACATAANGSNVNAEETKTRGVEQYAGDPRLGEKVNRACFISSIDGFGETTDDTIIMSTSPKKAFLFEVARGCLNLDHALSIGFDAHSSCASRGDHIIVSDSAFGLKDSSGFGPDRCLIKSIYAWNPRAEAADEDESEES